MISVPRLFTLALGDLQITELVLNLKLSSDFGSLARGIEAKSLSLLDEEVPRVSGEVAAHALRKLVPPSQRIELVPMNLLEALNYLPLNHREEDCRLHQLLGMCRLELPAPEKDLRELLLAKGFSLFEDSVDLWNSGGPRQAMPF